MSNGKWLRIPIGAALSMAIYSAAHAGPDKVLIADPVPPAEIALCQISFTFQTGNDDLRGGSNDNVYAAVNGDAWLGVSPWGDGFTHFRDSLNGGRTWTGWQRTGKIIDIPHCAISLTRLNTIRLATHFTGGIDGDNWDIRTVTVRGTGHFTDSERHRVDVCATLVNRSRYPAVFRFTGEVHNWDLEVAVTGLRSTIGAWGVRAAPCPG